MSIQNLDRRYRAWTFLIYPGDIPGELDWYVKLDDLHIPIAISPLHDMTLEGKPGQKDHYHIIFSFDGKKSYEQVKELIQDNLSVNGQNCGFTRPEPVQCLASYYRYLCHLDSEDKVKYDPEAIMLLGGFNPHKYIDEQAFLFLEQMSKCIDEQGFTEFDKFDEYCRLNYPDTWFRLLPRYHGYISTKIRSKRHWKEGR